MLFELVAPETTPPPRFRSFNALCKALTYFVRVKKTMLRATPEIFEDLQYALVWRKKIETLSSLIDTRLYAELSLHLGLTERILQILNEVWMYLRMMFNQNCWFRS